MFVHCFTFNAIQENTYLVYDESKECVIIDPGCYSKAEQQTLQDFITAKGLKVVKLLNTHCHVDHVLGNDWVKRTYHVKLHLHPLEEAVLRAVPLYAAMYGFPQYAPAEPDVFIDQSQEIKFGSSTLAILFVPGHSVGHLAFYSPQHNFCISGDVLFYGSIGRTDLPGGDFDTLKNSIYQTMYKLPDETKIYAGHGQPTTIGREKKYNSFFVAN
jgi:hydroxyacylglutathione hydrolase